MIEPPVRVAGVPLPLLMLMLSAIGGVFGAGISYASLTSGPAEAAKELARFEHDAKDRFTTLDQDREKRDALITTRIDTLGELAAARMTSMDRRDELRLDRMSSIDNRLNRLEAQLAYMVLMASNQRDGVRK